MAEPADALLLRAVEAKENVKWTASGSGRRVGCLSHGLRRQNGSDAWPARSEGQRRVAPRGRRVLNLPNTVARHSVIQSSLTVQLQRVKMTKPLINSENRVHESCRAKIGLQQCFRHHQLNHDGSQVISSQSRVHETETATNT